jgi:anthranilate synthase component 1
MLLDLGRNDAGRVAKTGTVRVSDPFIIERYSHVMHIVSNVEADAEGRRGRADVLKATFPAGTVSGAPKVRAMEIIDELEPSKRGIYAGSGGYLGFNGDMDLASRSAPRSSRTAGSTSRPAPASSPIRTPIRNGRKR